MNLKNSLLFLSLLTCLPCFGQKFSDGMVRISTEQQADGKFLIYGEHDYLAPISVWLEFSTLKNLTPNGAVPYKAVIKAGEKKKLLLTLTPKPKAKTDIKYVYKYTLGDYTKARHQIDYAYCLPFLDKATYKLSQGYFGKFSHEKQHCIDFDMPEGTEIVAAREGTVIAMRKDSDQGGATRDFADLCNYVIIYHADGTFANYLHFKKDGVMVSVGQQIKKGESIGYSGNTGWSSGPHLHFEVYQPNTMLPEKKTIPTKFRVAKGKIMELKEGEKYTGYQGNE